MRGTQPVGMKDKGVVRLQTGETQCDRQGLAVGSRKERRYSQTPRASTASLGEDGTVSASLWLTRQEVQQRGGDRYGVESDGEKMWMGRSRIACHSKAAAG